jgi:Dolichyl-phosphate-mannose-protein mannosyltransferase
VAAAPTRALDSDVLLVLAPLLLYALGAFVEAALDGPADDDWAPAALFRRLLLGLLLAGWVGVTLAELGRFSAAALGALVAVAVALLGTWLAARPSGAARDRAGLAVGRSGAVRDLAGADVRQCGGVRALARAVATRGRGAPRGELLALVGVLALAGALFGQPGEDVLGARDPGIYFATGVAIARQGAVLQDDPALRALAADLGDVSINYWLFQSVHGWPLRFPGQLFVRDLAQGVVEPGFLPWYPLWIATAVDVGGLEAGLWVNPLLAMLALLAVYCTARLLLGPLAAALGAALLAVNLGQVWFARYTMAEPAAQLLVWTGLYALAAAYRRPSATLGLLAGLAWGSALLARVDTVLLVPPVAAYFVWQTRAPARRRGALVALGVLGLLALQFALHAWRLAPGYHSMVFSRATLAVAAGGVALVLVLAAGAWLLTFAPRGTGRDWRPAVVLGGLALAAAFAYLVRPLLPLPPLSGEAAELEAAARESLVRLGWYVTPLGLVLALTGVGGLLRRERWRPALPLLGLLALSLAFYLPNPLVSSDQPWAVRRYLPLVLPGLCLLAAYGSVASAAWLAGVVRAGSLRGQEATDAAQLAGSPHPPGDAVGGAGVSPLANGAGRRCWASRLLAVALCLAVGWGEWQATEPIALYREHAGALRQVEALAALVPPDAIVLFPRSSDGMRLSLPLHYLGRRPAFVLPAEGPDEGILAVVRRWRARGQAVVWVVPLGTRFPTPPGMRFVPAGLFSFEVPQLERPLDRLPRAAEPLHFPLQLYRVELAPEEAR